MAAFLYENGDGKVFEEPEERNNLETAGQRMTSKEYRSYKDSEKEMFFFSTFMRKAWLYARLLRNLSPQSQQPNPGKINTKTVKMFLQEKNAAVDLKAGLPFSMKSIESTWLNWSMIILPYSWMKWCKASPFNVKISKFSRLHSMIFSKKSVKSA